MQEIKLPSAWVRACLFHGKLGNEFIYRVRNVEGKVTEGLAGRLNITSTVQLPDETKRERQARIEAGDITYTLWGAVETKIIKEQDGVLTVVLPDNKVVEVSERRVITRDRE